MNLSNLANIVLLFFSIFSYADVGHQLQGTDYCQKGVQAYAQFRHGMDGTLFLDPYFLPFIQNLKNKKLLDAGCGAGPWSIFAAQNGATVCALDIQEGMIHCAKKAALENQVHDCIHFDVGSVSNLLYADNTFDCAISINVGCNLPTEVFSAHFKELFRTLKRGGKAVITAPTSFDVVFAQNKTMHEVKNEIEQMLAERDCSKNEQIREKLNKLNTVLRATFVERNGNLLLVADEKMLIEGEAIWRKIPGLVVPNYYHAEKHYIEEILNAGFTIERIDRPRFETLEEWKKAGSGLAKEYCYYPAFVIFHITK